MGFTEHLKDGLRVLILRREASLRLSKDRDALGTGLLVVLLAGLAFAIWRIVTVLGWWDLLLSPLWFLVVFLLLVFLVHLTASILGGEGTYLGLVRPLSCAFILGWLLILPFVGIPLLLWYLVAAVWVVASVHGTSRLRAIAAIAIPLAFVWILFLAGVGAWTLTRPFFE